MESKVIIAIPARLASQRLPNKVFASINNERMIDHVISFAKTTGLRVIVACADEDIVKAAQENGVEGYITPVDLPSGSDRIYHAIASNNLCNDDDIIINLQCDVLNMKASLVEDLLQVMKDNKDCDIGTLGFKIDGRTAKDNNIVKIIGSIDGNNCGKALYFSRCPAPFNAIDYYEHIGIYGFRYKSLKRFISFKQSPLEKLEKLEQLRALENNMNIYFKIVDHKPISIDTQEALDIARAFLAK